MLIISVFFSKEDKNKSKWHKNQQINVKRIKQRKWLRKCREMMIIR